MTMSRPILFAEFRRFRNGLGFKVKRAENAWVFQHPTEGLIALRLYGEEEASRSGICGVLGGSWK